MELWDLIAKDWALKQSKEVSLNQLLCQSHVCLGKLLQVKAEYTDFMTKSSYLPSTLS